MEALDLGGKVAIPDQRGLHFEAGLFRKSFEFLDAQEKETSEEFAREQTNVLVRLDSPDGVVG